MWNFIQKGFFALYFDFKKKKVRDGEIFDEHPFRLNLRKTACLRGFQIRQPAHSFEKMRRIKRRKNL